MYQLKSIKQNIDDFVLTVDDCHFEKGKIYAVTGANGSGKTTLLDILSFVCKPTEGDVVFDGDQVRHDDKSGLIKMRRRIACLMQNPYLFNMSVLNNVAYGLKLRGIEKEAINTQSHSILDKMNLSQLARKNAHALSKGESQRVGLARTLVIDAPVYLLDEPSANVDKKNLTVIEELITDLKKTKGATVIFSTHSSRQAERIADKVIELELGKIINS